MDTVVEITAAGTYDLRRRILRNGTASDVVEFTGDDEPTTFHLGVRDEHGVLIAISTWLARECPSRPGVAAHQLRGMATEPDLRGAGFGARLLAAGIERCAVAGSHLVWANARSTALAFYRRHGFEVVGAEYVDSTTGLPHVQVVSDTI